jgi:hypothetical protein
MLIDMPQWSVVGDARLAVVLWVSWVMPLTVTEILLRSASPTRVFLRTS